MLSACFEISEYNLSSKWVAKYQLRNIVVLKIRRSSKLGAYKGVKASRFSIVHWLLLWVKLCEM